MTERYIWECDCECHTTGAEHITKCCELCPVEECGTRIQNDNPMLELHFQEMHPDKDLEDYLEPA